MSTLDFSLTSNDFHVKMVMGHTCSPENTLLQV